MQLKKRKAKRVKTSHGSEINAEVIKYLRILNPSESFYFYEAIGKPTGQSASDLKSFLETIKSVKTESLQFHLERKDFQNWIEKTIGDTTLARRIEKINKKHEYNFRAKIQSTLEKRIKQLTGSTLTMIVDTEQTVTL